MLELREARANQIRTAFEAAGAETELNHNTPGMPYACLRAFVNYGYQGQRQALVFIEDDGGCSVYLSKIYDVAPGQRGRDILLADIPVLFSLPASTEGIAQEIVNRVRKVSSEAD